MKKLLLFFLTAVFLNSCASTPKNNRTDSPLLEKPENAPVAEELPPESPTPALADEESSEESSINEESPIVVLEDNNQEDHVANNVVEDDIVETADPIEITEEKPSVMLPVEEEPLESVPVVVVPPAVTPKENVPPPAITQKENPPAERQPNPPAAEKQPPAETKFSVLPETAPEPFPVEDFSFMPVENEAPQHEFSRTVRATVGMLVEIPYRGTGWVFTGETAARRGIVFVSRRLDTEGESFIFRAEAAGSYSLKFYLQDFIRDFILNDYVQVIIGADSRATGSGWFNPQADRDRITALPRWPLFDNPAQVKSPAVTETVAEVPAPSAPAPNQPPVAVQPQQAQPAAVPSPVPNPPAATQPQQTQPPAPRPPPAISPGVSQVKPLDSAPAGEGAISGGQPSNSPSQLAADSPPDAYLKKAREEFSAGRIVTAISVLDLFRTRYPAGSDEAWWLYGQCYEANSPSRNILAALDYYRRLVRDFPQSGRATEARRRIAYLERYYINIQ
jgi:hypothetical protein